MLKIISPKVSNWQNQLHDICAFLVVQNQIWASAEPTKVQQFLEEKDLINAWSAFLNDGGRRWSPRSRRSLFVSSDLVVFPFPPQYNKHLFVHIGQTNHSYSDALLESVDIRQIYDKFPEKKGGLKELYGKGPQNSFFLIKFWVSCARFDLWDVGVTGQSRCKQSALISLRWAARGGCSAATVLSLVIRCNQAAQRRLLS